MRKLTVVLAFGIMISMASGAGAITTNGDWSDWFGINLGPGEDINTLMASPTWDESRVVLNNDMIRTVVDEEGPTPGGGGQRYDIEQIFYFFEDFDTSDPASGGRLHIGLVTGFPPEGVPTDDLYAGDLFIGLGGAGGLGIGDFDIAIATSTASAARGQNTPLNPTPDIDYFGRTWVNDGTWNDDDARHVVVSRFRDQGDPYRLVEDPNFEQDLGTQIQWGGMGVHNFLEVSIAVDAGIEEQITGEFGGLRLHWTMECGNDVINVQDNTPFAPPVPEPSTMVLLGMGMLGAVMRKKFTA